jgi:hypothetical protein
MMGGEGGIRTPEAHRLTVFKTAAINRSATSPNSEATHPTARHKRHYHAWLVYQTTTKGVKTGPPSAWALAN